MSTQGTKKVDLIGVFIWSLAAGFYLYEFFLRVFVGTLSTQVIAGLNLTSQQFALLGLGYYLTYSLMQIPVGILIDRFGAHLLLTIATFLAALGGFWFAYSHNFINGFASRCFMGFGSSFAYVSLLVLALNWFPRKYFGLMAGAANFLGAIGPILAGAPLAILLKAFNNDWRIMLAGTGGFGFALAIMIGFFVRNRPKRVAKEVIHLDPSKNTMVQKLKLLLTNSQVYPIILFAGFNYVSIPLLGAYWGTSFLQARGFSLEKAAMVTSLLWVGLALGAPFIGRISDKIKRRKSPLLVYGCIGIVTTFGVVFWPSPSTIMMSLFFFFTGIACSGMSLSFAIVAENIPHTLRATGIGLNNSAITFFAAVLPQLVTMMINRRHMLGNGDLISLSSFRYGLGLMPLFFVLALCCLFFIRETFCRQHGQVVKVNPISIKLFSPR